MAFKDRLKSFFAASTDQLAKVGERVPQVTLSLGALNATVYPWHAQNTPPKEPEKCSTCGKPKT